MSGKLVDFDHHSPAFARDWESILAELREHCPVAETSAHGGFKVVSRYADVRQAAQDWQSFSSDNDVDGTGDGGQGVVIPRNPVRMGFVERDPPLSLDYRRPLTKLFSATAIEAFEPRMNEIVRDCVERLAAKAEGDFVADLAMPVAVTATLDFIGLPLERADHYGDLLHRLVFTDRTSAAFAEVIDGLNDLISELTALSARRRVERRRDVISDLIDVEVSGRPLSDAEIADIAYMLLNGGVDTSIGLGAQILLYLQKDPEAKARLVAHPELLDPAIEELLRFFSPAMGAGRNAMADTEIAGCPIHRGDRLWLAYASANRDPAAFPDPDLIILDRKPNQHLAFGWGVHRCIGMYFARLEMKLLVAHVLRTMPDYRIIEDRIVRYTDIGTIHAVAEMPVRVR